MCSGTSKARFEHVGGAVYGEYYEKLMGGNMGREQECCAVHLENFDLVPFD